MRKFYISFSDNSAIEKNANEYSVYPKTNTFGAKFDGKEITAAFTSGKGKSAIPNYYLYFRDEKNSIFYFRSSPDEIESAKKGFSIFSVAAEAFESGELPASEFPALASAVALKAAPAKARSRRKG
jgi:hypothetical protein